MSAFNREPMRDGSGVCQGCGQVYTVGLYGAHFAECPTPAGVSNPDDLAELGGIRAQWGAALEFTEQLRRIQDVSDSTAYALAGLCSPSMSPEWTPEQIRRSHRPCSECGDPGHAGALCLSVPDAVPPGLTDYVDGLARLREVSDRIEERQRARDVVTVPDAAQAPDDPGTTIGAVLRRLQARSGDVAAAFAGIADRMQAAVDHQRRVLEAEARDGVQPGSTVHLYPVSPAQQLARQGGISPAQAVVDLEAATMGMWCFHPHAVCREWPQSDGTGRSVLVASCPGCGMSAHAVDAYPVLAAKPLSSTPSRYVQAEEIRLRAAEAEIRSAEAQPDDGLGTHGRNVPDHRPRSWTSGRPWDRTEPPQRDAVPEHRAPGGPRAAADRVRRGVW